MGLTNVCSDQYHTPYYYDNVNVHTRIKPWLAGEQLTSPQATAPNTARWTVARESSDVSAVKPDGLGGDLAIERATPVRPPRCFPAASNGQRRGPLILPSGNLNSRHRQGIVK